MLACFLYLLTSSFRESRRWIGLPNGTGHGVGSFIPYIGYLLLHLVSIHVFTFYNSAFSFFIPLPYFESAHNFARKCSLIKQLILFACGFCYSLAVRLWQLRAYPANIYFPVTTTAVAPAWLRRVSWTHNIAAFTGTLGKYINRVPMLMTSVPYVRPSR